MENHRVRITLESKFVFSITMTRKRSESIKTDINLRGICIRYTGRITLERLVNFEEENFENTMHLTIMNKVTITTSLSLI